MLVRLEKGYCSLLMARCEVACRVCTYPSRDLLMRPTFYKWRWHTLRSSFSWSFTSPISAFLLRMKLISPLASCNRDSALADSALFSSNCSTRALHFSFSADNCFTFSRISLSSFLRSSSLLAKWNCSSWQSFSLLATSPWLIDTAVSNSLRAVCRWEF